VVERPATTTTTTATTKNITNIGLTPKLQKVPCNGYIAVTIS